MASKYRHNLTVMAYIKVPSDKDPHDYEQSMLHMSSTELIKLIQDNPTELDIIDVR